MKLESPTRDISGKILIPVGLAISLLPFMNSAMALLLGMALALFFGNPYLDRTRRLTKNLLAWSIVGLGAGINLHLVWKAGVDGFVFTLISLTCTLFIGFWIGKLFKSSPEISILINVGTAICGGSAIAAVASVIQAKDESVSVSLGVVFILNAIALFIFPHLGHFFGMSQEQFGLWGALAIHDTSSVVGATMQYGEKALEIGTTIKLMRSMWIIPVSLLFAVIYVKDKKSLNHKSVPFKWPWFILGFLCLSALVTNFQVLQSLGHNIEWLSKRTLVATIFLIGTSLTLKTLQKVGSKTLLHGLTLWIIVTGASLALSR